jgi:hypothetical protein
MQAVADIEVTGVQAEGRVMVSTAGNAKAHRWEPGSIPGAVYIPDACPRHQALEGNYYDRVGAGLPLRSWSEALRTYDYPMIDMPEGSLETGPAR